MSTTDISTALQGPWSSEDQWPEDTRLIEDLDGAVKEGRPLSEASVIALRALMDQLIAEAPSFVDRVGRGGRRRLCLLVKGAAIECALEEITARESGDADGVARAAGNRASLLAALEVVEEAMLTGVRELWQTGTAQVRDVVRRVRSY
jgi:hypothetical protein